MKKHVLRETGFESTDKIANGWKKLIILIFWLILAAAIISGTFTALIKIVRLLNPPPDDYFISSQGIDISFDAALGYFHLIGVIGSFVLYFIIKIIITSLFCSDKEHGVRLRLLEHSVVPTCFCSEGLTVLQTFLIYFIPVISVYSTLFIICVILEAEGGFMTILFFISLFMVFDLEIAFYAVILKIKDKARYIAVNNHIYNITVFK